MREVAESMGHVAALEQRVSRMVMDGPVHAVDPAAQRVRLRLGGGDDEPFLSPWVHYAQAAGGLKLHSPPTVGQQMRLTSPGGDLRQGCATPLTWSEAVPSPSAAPDQHVLVFGDVTITLSASGLKAQVGTTVLELTATAAVLKRGESEVLTLASGAATLKGAEVRTQGPTKLNNGTREVVVKGSVDSLGGVNATGGGSGVLV